MGQLEQAYYNIKKKKTETTTDCEECKIEAT